MFTFLLKQLNWLFTSFVYDLLKYWLQILSFYNPILLNLYNMLHCAFYTDSLNSITNVRNKKYKQKWWKLKKLQSFYFIFTYSFRQNIIEMWPPPPTEPIELFIKILISITVPRISPSSPDTLAVTSLKATAFIQTSL